MYAVSEAYKKAIQLHRDYGVRNGWKKNIYLGQFDSLARDDASLSVSAGTSYSDDSILNTSTTQAASYATFEGNAFTLDGSQLLMPTGNYLQQGYISSAISKDDGTFDTPPYIEVVFGEPHSMVGITVLFDDTADIFASEYTVTTYLSGIEQASHVVSNDASKSTPELGLTDFDRMVIVFTKTNQPYQRIHVQNIGFGIGYTFGDEDIVSITIDRETSPVGLEIPKTDISFTLLNTDGRFDVDADIPIVEFLKGDQYVDITLSYDVTGDGGYEPIKMPRMWLKSWSVDGIKAKFQCRDVFSRYSEEKYETSTYGEQTALELVEETMRAAGVTNYDASGTMLSLISTVNPLPAIPYSECWQIIANLAMATLEEDEDGTIIFRYRIDPSLDNVVFSGKVEDYTPTENATDYDAPIRQYATFEQDFFALDGGMLLQPENDFENVGVIWDAFPGNTETPEIVMEFEDNSTAGAVNLSFDPYYNPESVELIGERYENGAYKEVYRKTYEVNSPILNANDKFDRVKRITIKITGNKKQQRTRLQRIAITWDSGFEITEADILGTPHGEVLTACRNVVATLTNLSPMEESQIAKKTVTVGETIRIQHGNPAIINSVTAEKPKDKDDESSEAVEIPQEYIHYTSYAYYTDVTVDANDIASDKADVIITGQRLTDETMKTASLAVSRNGEDCIIENPLLNDASISDEFLPWNADYLGSRVEWEVETLGYPELQPGDRINYKGKKAYVKRTVITTQSGSMRGKLTLRRKGYTN